MPHAEGGGPDGYIRIGQHARAKTITAVRTQRVRVAGVGLQALLEGLNGPPDVGPAQPPHFVGSRPCAPETHGDDSLGGEDLNREMRESLSEPIALRPFDPDLFLCGRLRIVVAFVVEPS